MGSTHAQYQLRQNDTSDPAAGTAAVMRRRLDRRMSSLDGPGPQESPVVRQGVGIDRADPTTPAPAEA